MTYAAPADGMPAPLTLVAEDIASDSDSERRETKKPDANRSVSPMEVPRCREATAEPDRMASLDKCRLRHVGEQAMREGVAQYLILCR